MVDQPAPREFHANPPAECRRPIVKIRGLEIDPRYQLDRACASGAKLGAAMKQLRWQRLRLTSENPLAPAIQTKRPDFLRGENFERLEREILAFDVLASEQILVSEVRALMVESECVC